MGVSETVIDKPGHKDPWIKEIWRVSVERSINHDEVIKLFDYSPIASNDMDEISQTEINDNDFS